MAEEERGFADSKTETVSRHSTRLISDLLENYHNLKPAAIEKSLADISKNRATFDLIIEAISSSPEALKLELAMAALIRFGDNEYKDVIDYIESQDLNNFTRAYLVEAIPLWDSISPEQRKRDLGNALHSENSKLVQDALEYALESLCE